MNGYTVLLASDVTDRDGLGLELYGPAGELLAEVFRYDDQNGRLVFTSLSALVIEADVMSWFLERAREDLAGP